MKILLNINRVLLRASNLIKDGDMSGVRVGLLIIVVSIHKKVWDNGQSYEGKKRQMIWF